MKRLLIRWIMLVVVVFWHTASLLAQCPMCKAAAESNLKEGGKHALGLNAGILYLAAVPYLLIGLLGWWWWRKNRHTHSDEVVRES